MAQFKYAGVLARNDDPAFDAIHAAGDPAPYGGIYRCGGCHQEVGVARPPLPTPAKARPAGG